MLKKTLFFFLIRCNFSDRNKTRNDHDQEDRNIRNPQRKLIPNQYQKQDSSGSSRIVKRR